MLRFPDPFEELERAMTQFGGRWRGGIMPMDAYEQDGHYTLRFDLPGVDPDAVDLTVENRTLTVTASRRSEDLDDVNWLLRERPTGQHSRQVRLGETLDTGKVDASYESGVLTVTIPMREESKPRKVSIQAKEREAIAAGA
ncbi:MAG: Hsp20/alpha crystallin family protein [Acidimicrobiia bacterium]|nr:Hsp20/alpha crystallin family protein [Acidimicrobiia bacterium]